MVINAEHHFTAICNLQTKMGNGSDLTIKRQNEWIHYNPLQEKYGPLRRMKYNPELRWAYPKCMNAI